MSHTVKSFNTLVTYNCYPLEFKHDDKIIIFSRLYSLWGKPFRTRCDCIELGIISTPENMDIIEEDKAICMQIFHN